MYTPTQIPLDVIASWPTPNYVDPVTRGPGLLITNIVLTSISFVLTALRLYTRGFITATIGLDDVLIVLALLTTIGMGSITSLAAVRYGWDRHIWDIPFEWFPSALKCRMSFEITFCAASTFTKLSLLWFCRRIIGSSTNGKFRNLNYSLIGAMALLSVLGVLFVFIALFTCVPVKASFDLLPLYHYRCLNGHAIIMAASVTNVLTDFLTTIVPMPLIWRLNLPRRQRLAVISIFGIGISVTVSSSIRTYYAWMNTYGSYDESWYGWSTCLAAAVEINVGLMCASAPALRPLIKAVYPRILASTKPSGYVASNQQKPQPWQSTSQSSNQRVLNPSRDPEKKKTTSFFERRARGTDTGIVRTVELGTYVEERKDAKHGQSLTANSVSARGRPGVEARDAYEMFEFNPGAEAQMGSFLYQDSSRESRSVNNEDEEQYTPQRMV